MRIASFAALAAGIALLATSVPADAQRERTRIIIKKRSFLDAGTTVKPGEARYTNYLLLINPRLAGYGPMNDNINARFPLPGPYELPGYPRY